MRTEGDRRVRDRRAWGRSGLRGRAHLALDYAGLGPLAGSLDQRQPQSLNPGSTVLPSYPTVYHLDEGRTGPVPPGAGPSASLEHVAHLIEALLAEQRQ